ncbi:MAG: lamin tail domain-containing protein [Chitinophagaceae bacterium]|nr:lamin tail domain-containing protein [Chitinophagaceae bacterium]
MKNTLLAIAIFLYSSHLAAQSRYDVVINEIMSNPSPSVGLPEVKYIELLNVSSAPVELKSWTLSDGSSTALIRTDFTLQPDSFVIISSASGSAALTVYGNVISVTNFPTLRVNGDRVILRSADNTLIHAVEYYRSWHGNEVKSNGGWSLEMTDAKNPCGGGNWKSSNDLRGGTPGLRNSVAAENKDEDPPVLVQSYAEDSMHVILVFNEPLDSAVAAVTHHYAISGNAVIIEEAEPLAPLFDRVRLVVSAPLEKNKIYEVTVQSAGDCAGNLLAPAVVRTGLAGEAQPQDIVFNEILFNPPENGTDYIELYNRGKQIINSKNLWITNRSSAGNPGTLRQLSQGDRLIFPGDFIVLTENANWVRQQFITPHPDAFIELSTMPSLPNQSGNVVLLNNAGDVIDELKYEEKWHFPLITNYKGVALERINPDKSGSEKSNWFSAASSVNYGTPGYRNSQFRADLQLQGDIHISPNVFSPDNDGYDDFLSIGYHFPGQGYVCSITAFDAAGRPVKKIVQNGICGLTGNFRWDGLDENNQRLPVGIYIILTEVYNLQGKTKKFKTAVTLARNIR